MENHDNGPGRASVTAGGRVIPHTHSHLLHDGKLPTASVLVTQSGHSKCLTVDLEGVKFKVIVPSSLQDEDADSLSTITEESAAPGSDAEQTVEGSTECNDVIDSTTQYCWDSDVPCEADQDASVLNDISRAAGQGEEDDEQAITECGVDEAEEDRAFNDVMVNTHTHNWSFKGQKSSSSSVPLVETCDWQSGEAPVVAVCWAEEGKGRAGCDHAHVEMEGIQSEDGGHTHSWHSGPDTVKHAEGASPGPRQEHGDYTDVITPEHLV